MKRLAIFAFVIAFLAIGVLSYKLFLHDKITISFLNKSPKTVLDLMMKETPKLSSFAYQNKTDIKIDYEEKDYDIKNSFLIKEEVTGTVNKKNPEETKAKQLLSASLDLGGMSFSVEMESRKIGKMSYFKMNVMPFIFKMFMGDESEGKWYEINEDDWNNLSEQGKTQASSMYSVTVKENSERSEKLSADIKEYIKENNLLEFKEKLPDEVINSRKNYHYKVGLNQETVEGVKEILSKFIDEELVLEGEPEQVEFIKEMISQLDKIITKLELELWIDKSKFYLTQVNFDIDLDFSQIELSREEFEEMLNSSLKVNIKGYLSLSRFNEDIQIEKPEGATPLNEILEGEDSFYGFGGSQESSRDARRIADIKQTQTALELYYNDNNRYPSVVEVGESIKANEITYMIVTPQNPLPNDGICDADFEYRYMVKPDGQEYSLVYCLGEETGVISPGYHIGTPAGVNDFEEIWNTEDSDDDGLNYYEENFYGTDPNNPDSDGDGHEDGVEVEGGYNPAGEGIIFEIEIEKLTVAVSERPPLVFKDENGNFQGYEIDLINEIAKKINMEVEIQEESYSDIFRLLDNKQVKAGLSSISITPEDSKRVLFSIPHLTSGKVILLREDDNSVLAPGDLKDKKVAVLNDQKSINSVKVYLDDPEKQTVAFFATSEMIKSLKEKTVDAVVLNYTTAAYLAKSDPAIKVVGDPFTQEYYGIAFNRGDYKLSTEINGALRDLKREGKLKEIENKWFQ